MTSGVKHDDEKPRWNLLPMRALEPVVRVLMFGAKKYAVDNWKDVLNARERYFEAMMRHLADYQAGERFDHESGLPILGHVGCCLAFLLAFETGVAVPIELRNTSDESPAEPTAEPSRPEVIETSIVPAAHLRMERPVQPMMSREERWAKCGIPRRTADVQDEQDIGKDST